MTDRIVGRRGRDGLVRTVACLAILAAGAPAALARAQDPSMIDQGRFEIRIGGTSRGQESFAIRRQGEEYMAVGRTSLEGEELWIQSAEIGLRTNSGLDPLRYEFRTLQSPRATIIAVRTGSRIKVTSSDSQGERLTELRADRELVLVQAGVAHHYWFVVKKLASEPAGAPGDLEALEPGAMRLAPVRLVRASDVDLAFPEGPARRATRYDIRIGESDHVVWVERGSGIVLRAEIPERAWVAVRVFEVPESSAVGERETSQEEDS